MDKRFTVTIHDLNGVKQYNLHQIVKKVLLYAGAGLVTFIAAGVAFIFFLNASLDTIDEKKRALEEHNAELRESILSAENDLQAKQEELSVVSDKLGSIETLIGLAPEAENTLLERVEIANLTSAQRAVLLQHIPSGSPVEYKGITSKFGYRIHPTLQRKELHRGTDLRAAMKTKLYATADGVIEYAGNHKASGYGRLIILDHNYGFKTYYGHLNKILVKAGQYVKKGDLIGLTGNSGMSNGPHLHYEVRYIQRVLNPYWFVKWDVENYNTIFEKETKVPWQFLVATITQDHNLQNPVQTTPPSSQLALLSKVK
ncbi:M23 family metallopeptidase [Sulfurimonas sp. HSL3-7]|uniref:M23 family metallopeptidase n=1 Tax=Sulfonitrofixus jiaomeiensis TaxID=3131938 RepID=UPI0031F77D9C